MIGASFAACAINVGARSEFNAAFAWLSARHITSLSISATACLSVEVSVKAPFSSGLATPS